MPTLLLRMRAPMMSWGDHSRFTIRDTRREPTKSAVIGLLCAALGRPRWESVDDLAVLKMGVRVNQEGLIQCDYHTVMDSIKSSGSKGDTVLSDRYYVADADYLVGLEGDASKLAELDAALQSPCWQLKTQKYKLPEAPLRYLLEVSDSLDVRQDVPIDWQKRLFGSRCVKAVFHKVEEACIFQS
jgi:CRISPR system Cascade subunit CasD